MRNTIETQKTLYKKSPTSTETIKEQIKTRNKVDEIMEMYNNKQILIDYLFSNGCTIVDDKGSEVVARYKDGKEYTFNIKECF